MQWKSFLAPIFLLLCTTSWRVSGSDLEAAAGLEEEDWGEGLRVLTTYKPDKCEHRAKKSDVIHYHYVGKLGSDGTTFGRSFDYDSPYIVSLGHGRIISGMDRGLMGMCLWERRRITIPPQLGYGSRGVGTVIPPDSTLVFYVRLIRIERNGHALGEDQSIKDLWDSGLRSYSGEDWQLTVDMMEEALRLFQIYENQTYNCLRRCRDEEPELSEMQKGIVEAISSGKKQLIEQFLIYVARSNCITQCKESILPPKLRSPSSEVLEKFRQRGPYSYLHFSYYKLGNNEAGARCLFTYCFYHTSDTSDSMCEGGLAYYRRELGMNDEQIISREPGELPHQTAYLRAKQAYEEQEWLESADYFETALSLYKEALDKCLLMCEDILHVNLTQEGMNPQKRAKFDELELSFDSMEFYPLLVKIITNVLQCRITCHDRMATVNGSPTEDYFLSHFHYLQFDYYKTGMLKKAAEAAATYLAINPSDQTMANNVRYYTTKLKVPTEYFVPWSEYIEMQKRLETEKRLMHFAKNGEPKKREGMRGDDALPQHQEL